MMITQRHCTCKRSVFLAYCVLVLFVSVATLACNPEAGTDSGSQSSKSTALAVCAGSAVAPQPTQANELKVSAIAGDGAKEYADGSAVFARFDNNMGAIAVSKTSNPQCLYVVDNIVGSGCFPKTRTRIRVVNIDTQEVRTLAGHSEAGYVDAVGTAAWFNEIAGLEVSPGGTIVCLAEAFPIKYEG